MSETDPIPTLRPYVVTREESVAGAPIHYIGPATIRKALEDGAPWYDVAHDLLAVIARLDDSVDSASYMHCAQALFGYTLTLGKKPVRRRTTPNIGRKAEALTIGAHVLAHGLTLGEVVMMVETFVAMRDLWKDIQAGGESPDLCIPLTEPVTPTGAAS